MTCDQTIVIAGGGLSGLMLADFLRRRDEAGRVVVVESESECGGLLRSFDYGSWGRFDYGTHILSETGEAGLDEFLTGLLPADELHFLRGAQRDVAGLFWNGRLQTHTGYPDLTTLPSDEHDACLDDFARNLNDDDGSGAGNALEYLERRFGPRLATRVGVPLVEKFARAPAGELDLLVTRLCPLDRLAFFGPDGARDVLNTPLWGRRNAFVPQGALPLELRSKLAALYPRRRGVNFVIDALVRRLQAGGVEFLLGQRISALREENGALQVRLNGPNGENEITASRLFWTANLLALAPPAGVAVNFSGMDKPLHNVLCHFVVPEKPALGGAYYLYCGDGGFLTYRVTNYGAYCPEDNNALTVELLLDDEDFARGDFENRAFAELGRMGIVPPGSVPLFSRHEVLKYGFPRPTRRNMAEITRVRHEIEARWRGKIEVFGVGSRPGLFFMTDVLRDVFDWLQNRPRREVW